LPDFAVRGALHAIRLKYSLRGEQAGTNPVKLGHLLLRDLVIEPTMPRSVNDAIAETFGSTQR
jgi:hypothetical protein